eukprot:365036-Chlamydomonas_euryale.AAC.2
MAGAYHVADERGSSPSEGKAMGTGGHVLKARLFHPWTCAPECNAPYNLAQTEKLLLYGGAIQEAGEVKARRAAKHATSDWMELEKSRGISVSSTALTFEYSGVQVRNMQMHKVWVKIGKSRSISISSTALTFEYSGVQVPVYRAHGHGTGPRKVYYYYMQFGLNTVWTECSVDNIQLALTVAMKNICDDKPRLPVWQRLMEAGNAAAVWPHCVDRPCGPTVWTHCVDSLCNHCMCVRACADQPAGHARPSGLQRGYVSDAGVDVWHRCDVTSGSKQPHVVDAATACQPPPPSPPLPHQSTRE